ncbi:hypothetical protein A4X13_0g9442, partial [Tilletia indica]
AAALQLYAAQLDPFHFDWMDAPEPVALRAALLALVQLGAVRIPDSPAQEGGQVGVVAQITPLGRRMAALPLSPVHARTLLAASERGGPTVARQARDLVALLSVDRSVFVDASGFSQGAQTNNSNNNKRANHTDVEETRDEALSRRIRAGLIHRSGDHATALNVLYAFLEVLESSGRRGGGPAAAKTAAASVKAWCQANYVHEKTVRNVLHVRAQLRALFRQNGIVCDDDEEEGGRGGGGKKKGVANGHANGNGNAKGGHVNGKSGHVNGNGMDRKRQRMGRAGRVREGECYRLYTREGFEGLDEVAVPEILKTDLSAAALQLYAAQLDPFHFDWMDAPEPVALRAALLALVQLGAVRIPDSPAQEGGQVGVVAQITPLGRRMAALPLSPVHARTLLAASERGGPTVARQARDLVALLSVDRSVFVDASGFSQGA